jgi:orotidine-5'-phosphate decarboxylase
VVLALDSQYPNDRQITSIEKILYRSEAYICAIKVNFHVLLSFSREQVTTLNELSHSYGLQSIADIKLNDIGSTNSEAVTRLESMGFDCIIANPIMGKDGLLSLVEFAHKLKMGVISVIYTSTPYAHQSYGLNVMVNGKKNQGQTVPLYKIFLNYSRLSKVDGLVVGANQARILRSISTISLIPIYSPGVGIQGGDAKKAIENGSKYIIVGRSVLESSDPVTIISKMRNISNGLSSKVHLPRSS